MDFLNGDYMNQESTEVLTTEMIKHSKEIMTLLKRDHIDITEIDNYHIYPIADNDTPKLSADRLEYSLSNALFTYKLLDLEIIKEIYNDIEIQKNEENKISKKDLYEMKESEVIDIIESSRYKEIFNIWRKAKKVEVSSEEPKNVYYVHHGAKIRYIDPLFNGQRISKCCKIAKKMIENNLSYDMNKFVYLNFDFSN